MSSSIDIAYQELCRIRDDKNKEKEAKQLANQMMREVTLRFFYDWDSFAECNQITDFVLDGNVILNSYAQLFIEVAVVVNNYHSDEAINELRGLVTDMRKVATMVQTHETFGTYVSNANFCAAKAFEISKKH